MKVLFGDPYNKGYSILGSIRGSRKLPTLGNYPPNRDPKKKPHLLPDPCGALPQSSETVPVPGILDPGLGVYRGYIGIMENTMETTIL